MTIGDVAILDRAGLDRLVEVLLGEGYRVVGPVVRDTAIVLAELGSAAELPAGWGVDSAPGHFRLRRRSDAAVFAHVGQHTLDETLSETDAINRDIRQILDVTTVEWGVEVTLVELKDIQLPESMKRAMARQAEAEREKRAKIINAEGESQAAAALGEASDTMMAHPLALQLRNLQSLVEIGVGKNTTVVFPAPLMSTVGELGSFLSREAAAAAALAITSVPAPRVDIAEVLPNGDPVQVRP